MKRNQKRGFIHLFEIAFFCVRLGRGRFPKVRRDRIAPSPKAARPAPRARPKSRLPWSALAGRSGKVPKPTFIVGFTTAEWRSAKADFRCRLYHGGVAERKWPCRKGNGPAAPKGRGRRLPPRTARPAPFDPTRLTAALRQLNDRDRPPAARKPACAPKPGDPAPACLLEKALWVPPTTDPFRWAPGGKPEKGKRKERRNPRWHARPRSPHPNSA